MNNSQVLTKTLHISEEKQPVTYKPFIIGNQCFIIAQQNVRRIEDIACFSFGILNPSGEITVLDPAHYATLISLFLSQENKNGDLVITTAQNNSAGAVISNHILPVLPQVSVVNFPLSNEGSNHAKQSILPPYRFHCTRSTSSTEITSQSVERQQRPSSSKKVFFIDLTKNEPHDLFGSTSTDRCEYCGKLNAREQLKQKKILSDNGF